MKHCVIGPDRGADTLVRHVEVLRQAVAVTRAKRPFGIDARVVLPDRMHCVWTLPEGDADYSNRMSEIKGRFTRELGRSGPAATPVPRNSSGARGGRVGIRAGPDLRGKAPIWQPQFWEHHIRGDAAFAACVRYCWINQGVARVGRASAGVGVAIMWENRPRTCWGKRSRGPFSGPNARARLRGLGVVGWHPPDTFLRTATAGKLLCDHSCNRYVHTRVLILNHSVA